MSELRFISPLRYPGGKGRLAPYLSRVLASQPEIIDTYCEPYAGGAGAGLRLLADGIVDKLIINDLNPGIAAFWRTVFKQPDALLSQIENCRINIETWHEQRAIYLCPADKTDLELGFATFFLNRVNRSGMLSARPIGGLKQTGKWLLDARFNKTDLLGRIDRLRRFSAQVDVREDRAIDLIRKINRRAKSILMYVDPPYVIPGEELYMTEHSWSEHARLAKLLSSSPHPWILTYDADPRTRALYRDFRCLEFGISHTAQVQKVGSEYMFFGRRVRVPDQTVMRTTGEWVGAPPT